jgi:hypothetical protein
MSKQNQSTARAQGPAASGDPRTTHPAAVADAVRISDEGTSLSLEERRAMLRNESLQTALPTAPTLPGYHMCWLTTVSQYDTLQKRMRMGYTLVTQDEVAGFEHFKANSGQYANCVMCNEMVLAKIPLDIYTMMMQEFHHNIPLDQEEALRSRLQNFEQAQADSKGRSLVSREDGFHDNELVKRRPAPTQFA